MLKGILLYICVTACGKRIPVFLPQEDGCDVTETGLELRQKNIFENDVIGFEM
jgi:predicted small lipoprotein YifL